MPIQHVNRKGDTYYLHRGQTKTGKPKWFFSTKTEGELVESIPDSFEIYENANAQVFLRKIVPQLVTQEEVAVVEDGVRKLAKLRYLVVEPKKDTITVYLPNQNTAFLEGSITTNLGISDPDRRFTEMHRFLNFSPMMRFTLVDEEKRRFRVERWCFLGSIDNWFPLGGSGDLAKMVSKYVRHLGKDSFFELM